MTKATRILPLSALAVALSLAGALFVAPAQAEKSDRLKPLTTIQNDAHSDINSDHTELTGDVIVTQGTMILRAEKVDVRQTSDGYYLAHATGTADKQVTFHQARDEPGEFIEGSADQLEYDTRADTVRFIGHAVIRRLQGTAVVSEANGDSIMFDKRTEVVTMEGGKTSPNPGGRTRTVMMPRAASAPAAPASGVSLKPSLNLQPGKQPS